MPVVGIKTNSKLTDEQKLNLTEKLSAVFEKTSTPQLAKLIQFFVEDNIFMNFKGNANEKTAFVHALLSPRTTEEDKEVILKGFFSILTEHLNIPNDHIFICLSLEPFWGINANYVNFSKV